MTRTRRILLASVVLVAVVATAGIALAVVGPRAAREAAPVATTDPGVEQGDGADRGGDVLGEEFLADWVESDGAEAGRVVRRDQGDDTVSEGQAYGLLISAAVGDEASFDEIWDWTTENLQRADGLLAWQWSEGEIVDAEPASDADLDAARALVLAGDRFDRPDLTTAGTTLGSAILDRMTVETALGRILLPGTWAAISDPHGYNPSYASPAAYAQLGAATGDPRWAELQAGSAAVTTQLLAQFDLPPDWAQVHVDGTIEAMPGAAGTGSDVRYSYDAARLALRYAESCDAADVALAAELATTLDRRDTLEADLDLGGTAIGEAQSPLGYAARAAARVSAGDDDAARDDLATALELSDATPTYYGTAWTALSKLMLETDALGSCAPLQGDV